MEGSGDRLAGLRLSHARARCLRVPRPSGMIIGRLELWNEINRRQYPFPAQAQKWEVAVSVP
jgi:hypothetical protein